VQDAPSDIAVIQILADRLASMQQVMGDLITSNRAVNAAMTAHILNCSETHGPMGPKIAGMEEEQVIARKERLRIMRAIERLQRSQDRDDVESLAESIKELRKKRAARDLEIERERAVAETEKRIYGRFLPILGALAGGGAGAAQLVAWGQSLIGP